MQFSATFLLLKTIPEYHTSTLVCLLLLVIRSFRSIPFLLDFCDFSSKSSTCFIKLLTWSSLSELLLLLLTLLLQLLLLLSLLSHDGLRPSRLRGDRSIFRYLLKGADLNCLGTLGKLPMVYQVPDLLLLLILY